MKVKYLAEPTPEWREPMRFPDTTWGGWNANIVEQMRFMEEQIVRMYINAGDWQVANYAPVYVARPVAQPQPHAMEVVGIPDYPPNPRVEEEAIRRDNARDVLANGYAVFPY